MVNGQLRQVYIPETPAFVFTIGYAIDTLKSLALLRNRTNCRILYSLKPFVLEKVLSDFSVYLDGFSTSSLFESILAREVLRDKGTIHITSPSFKNSEFREIVDLCDFISFNSLSQWDRLKNSLSGKNKSGIRINPQLSFIKDSRYNPSRKFSKLGVPLSQLISVISNSSQGQLDGISGIHFHNNCDSSDLSQLLRTVEHIDLHLSEFLGTLEWINLGGGYLFSKVEDLRPFYETLDLLKSKYDLEVFIEPGADIVRDAGFIVSSVLDIFNSDDKTIAVLDTTVNHMPEIFEYQYEPDVVGHNENGKYRYILVGASCLAGDMFGEYAFDKPLEIGSRVIFSGMGAYTLVKASTFNGINLPTIYSLKEDGELVLVKQFTYEDFATKCGVDKHEFV